MKKWISLIVLTLSITSYASPTRFTCKVMKAEQGKNAVFNFTLNEIGTKNVDYIWPENEENFPFRASHGTAKVIEYGTYNGYVAHEKATLNLILFGDDSISVAAVYLYKNSGYRKGYLKAKFGTVEGGGFYSEVFCQLKAVK